MATAKTRESPLRRETARDRTPGYLARKSKIKQSMFPDDVRRALWVRCGGKCEACGRELPWTWHAHHRQTRALADHSLANGVALHPTCHVIGAAAVHQNPKAAQERGLIVSRYADPRLVPLRLPDGRLVNLHATQPEYVPVAGSRRHARCPDPSRST